MNLELSTSDCAETLKIETIKSNKMPVSLSLTILSVLISPSFKFEVKG
jgi:hypothetical protein